MRRLGFKMVYVGGAITQNGRTSASVLDIEKRKILMSRCAPGWQQARAVAEIINTLGKRGILPVISVPKGS